MLGIKNKLNAIRKDTDLCDERIRQLEQRLKAAKFDLEQELFEKDDLMKSIKITETEISNANKVREDLTEKLEAYCGEIEEIQSKSRAYAEQKNNLQEDIEKVEKQLKSALQHSMEYNVEYEEADRSMETLSSSSEKALLTRLDLEQRSLLLEKDIDTKLLKLRHFDDVEKKESEDEARMANRLRLIEGYNHHAEQRIKTGKVNVNRLQRLVQRAEMDVESLGVRSRATRVELQNA